MHVQLGAYPLGLKQRQGALGAGLYLGQAWGAGALFPLPKGEVDESGMDAGPRQVIQPALIPQGARYAGRLAEKRGAGDRVEGKQPGQGVARQPPFHAAQVELRLDGGDPLAGQSFQVRRPASGKGRAAWKPWSGPGRQVLVPMRLHKLHHGGGAAAQPGGEVQRMLRAVHHVNHQGAPPRINPISVQAHTSRASLAAARCFSALYPKARALSTRIRPGLSGRAAPRGKCKAGLARKASLWYTKGDLTQFYPFV